jgi:hypothetical protein
MPELPRDPLALSFIGISVFVVLWDVLLAGQIAQARRQARDMLAITALCGLFVAPAAVIALASQSAFTGRTVALVGWVWPATLALFVIQSGFALRRRLVTSLISAPILAYNVLLFVAALARYSTTWWLDAPPALLGVGAAHASVIGLVWKEAALWSPLAIQLPLLAPAYPARWRVSKTLRACLAAGAAIWALLAAVEYPSAVRAVSTFAALSNEALQERPRGDLALGVRILPTMRGPPPAAALERDLPLADSLDASVLAVVLEPAGATGLALDSLANALAALRRDSVLLSVSLGYDARDRARFAANADAYLERRLNLVDRVVRRLRPDVLLPALDPLEAGQRALGVVPLGWWMAYHERAAKLTHQLRPRTRVGVIISAFTQPDSLLYAWAVRAEGIDLVGFAFIPTFRGGGSVTARQRAADHWMSTQQKMHWVTSIRSSPYVFGEGAQLHAVLGTFAWASRHRRVSAVIIDGAGDYDWLTGLRRADGGLRPAVATLARAQRALRESEK